MSHVELLGAVASIMLLGALVTLCMKCRQSKVTRKNTCIQQRNLNEDQLRFQVIRTYTMIRQEQKSDESQPRRNTVQCPITVYNNVEPRYQNVMTENELDSAAAYIDPISMDYYNCRQFLRPPTVRDDSGEYENAVNIQTWENPSEIAGSLENEYADPDYVNTT
ncbi:linker for activation of T-cells family member 2 isoform X2 [Rhinatrema bivittatum]|uniref:linker for activation of T-cells family member 2 isoform X2 n=1 Tax=Rhinatrema bivittatum TaxID=194408 RepID=UPI00112E3795|nr:linker for activation of T-cells family member 2 isoform X2 [Rhinatrema bivittatum]